MPSTAISFPTGDDAAIARIATLPAVAQRKLEALRRADLTQRALVDGLYEQQRRVREQVGAAEMNLAMYDRQRPPHMLVQQGDSGQEEAEDPDRLVLVERIVSLKAELRRLSDEANNSGIGVSITDLMSFLAEQPVNKKWTAAPIPLIKPTKSEPLADILFRVRADQAALRDRLATIEGAPLTATEAKAAARAEIDEIAQRGAPDVSGLLSGVGIGWPTELLTTNGGGHHQYVGVAQVTAALPLIVWANRKMILSALEAEIDARADNANAFSATARTAAISECEAAILALQRREERIIEMIEDTTGQTIKRLCRDPLVLLGIEAR